MKRKHIIKQSPKTKQARIGKGTTANMSTRVATHAGSWYTDDSNRLAANLDGWLNEVGDEVQGALETTKDHTHTVPVPGARVVISPHAGYSYSGRAAAYAYKSLDLTNVKRIFILGPSHHFYLTNCALSSCQTYDTPVGQLPLDAETIAELQATGNFVTMSEETDEDEHSIEMQLPYLRHLMNHLGRTIPIVPILVGNTSASSERLYGRLLAPYLAKGENAFVVSSDFAHWGSRFRYTYYQPTPGTAGRHTARNLDRSDRLSTSSIPIHESIGHVDKECMAICESGNHEAWLQILKDTGNTVCGRHPIGVVLAAMEVLSEQAQTSSKPGKFRFVRYERSSDVVSLRDSSVSYASAFAAPSG